MPENNHKRQRVIVQVGQDWDDMDVRVEIIHEYEEEEVTANHIEQQPSPTAGATQTTAIFLSHTTADRSTAEDIVTCLVETIDIPPGQLRCTSVDGYGLQPGENFDVALHRDLRGARVIVGLLTTEAIGSGWVVMELGAGWGLGTTICPLLHGELSTDALPGPLARAHCARTSKPHELAELVKVVAKTTGFTLREERLMAAAHRLSRRVTAE